MIARFLLLHLLSFIVIIVLTIGDFESNEIDTALKGECRNDNLRTRSEEIGNDRIEDPFRLGESIEIATEEDLER